MRNHPDKKQFREESMYFGLWFQREYSPWWQEGMTPGTGGQPSSQKAGRPYFIHTWWGKREWAGRGRQRGKRSGREREKAETSEHVALCLVVPCPQWLLPFPTRLHLLKIPRPPQTVPPPEDKVLKYLMSLWKAFHIQITEDWQSSKCQAICPRWLQESKDSFSGSFPLCVWDCMWRGTYCRANNGSQGPSPE